METGSSHLAFVFPGQGSQYVGMGKDVYDASPAARQVFHQAEEILGIRLRQLIFEGPEEALRQTINAQPAILTVSVAILAALRERWGHRSSLLQPQVVAGHSLGQYAALVASNALDFREAVLLVRERGRLMQESGQERPGGMAAVIGLDHRILEDICRRVQNLGLVWPANYNAPSQIVLSGELPALAAAIELAIAEGARRVVQLAVSIAAHSPLMRRAAEQFAEIVQRFGIRDAQIPVISNITAQMIRSAEEVRRELVHHICESVRWTQSVRAMVESGVTTVVEIGPGDVLASLSRRIQRNLVAISLNDWEKISAYPTLLPAGPTPPDPA